jgi:hypothetical protein
MIIGNMSIKSGAKLKYLRTTGTKNFIIRKLRACSDFNALCHTIQDHLSYRLLSRNINTKIHMPLMLPVVLCGCETTAHQEKNMG